MVLLTPVQVVTPVATATAAAASTATTGAAAATAAHTISYVKRVGVQRPHAARERPGSAIKERERSGSCMRRVRSVQRAAVADANVKTKERSSSVIKPCSGG